MLKRPIKESGICGNPEKSLYKIMKILQKEEKYKCCL
jgi:hypothetical protein